VVFWKIKESWSLRKARRTNTKTQEERKKEEVISTRCKEGAELSLSPKYILQPCSFPQMQLGWMQV